jgi:hypothetical protein
MFCFRPSGSATGTMPAVVPAGPGPTCPTTSPKLSNQRAATWVSAGIEVQSTMAAKGWLRAKCTEGAPVTDLVSGL